MLLNKKGCATCQFKECCKCECECEYFAPVSAECEEYMVNQNIEQNRNEYYVEWDLYITNFYNN